MKAFILSLLTVCAVICALPTQGVKGWRGITPLHSKREDVERLLGKPNSSNKNYSSYDLDDQIVSIMYADGPPCGTSAVDEWRVPSNTVVNIHLSPKRELRFANINQSEYKETADVRVKNLFYYTNQEEGIRYTVQKTDEVPTGVVMGIDYMPTTHDYNLHCGCTMPSERSDDRSFYSPLDKYG
ncbi:MAG: hypothetical protein M3298_03375, partial [Thermoproteota archaeon]|nr:hypothetical protein [Thermoproteota archaeon]